MSSLPEEIEVDIFLRLPVKSILTCKCVCKPWLNLISSPKFINYHLTKNKNNHRLMFLTRNSKTPWRTADIFASISSSSKTSQYDEAVIMDSPFQHYELGQIFILGSCNDLICLRINTHSWDFDDCICVWNPATKEYKDIPLPSHPSNFRGHDYNRDSYEEYNIIYGFGYDCNIDNYKLVKFAHYKTSGYVQGEVYTLGSDLWKTIHVDCCYSFLNTSSGLFLNGALHWLCVTANQKKSTILSFNISNEKNISLPIPAENMRSADLGVLGECLWLLSNEWESNDVWVMLNYGVRESWTKQFTLTEPCWSTGYFDRFSCDLKVLSSLYKGEILLHTSKGFILHDTINGSKSEVSFRDNILEGGCVYAESLVSLSSGIYVGI